MSGCTRGIVMVLGPSQSGPEPSAVGCVSIRSTPDAIGDLLAGTSLTLSSAAGPLTAT